MSKVLNISIIIGLLLGATALADWDPATGDHKMHFPQLPDLQPTGMDVLANWPYDFTAVDQIGKLLADDWQCSEDGPVTDIHIWGSWLNNIFPTHTDSGGTSVTDPGLVAFKLSIHEDIPEVLGPDGNVIAHSRPGDELWGKVFNPGDTDWMWNLYADNVIESFYDPNQDEIIGSDNQVYQYNFYISDTDTDPAFVQEFGKIYWLDVMAIPLNDPNITPAVWGWKTSDRYLYPDPYTGRHFQDDAVYTDIDASGNITGWKELIYPFGYNHPYQGQSIDLAFVITPEPATLLVLALGLVPALLGRPRRS